SRLIVGTLAGGERRHSVVTSVDFWCFAERIPCWIPSPVVTSPGRTEIGETSVKGPLPHTRGPVTVAPDDDIVSRTPTANPTPTHCPYCSLQCGISVVAGDRPAVLQPQPDFPTNRGGLC